MPSEAVIETMFQHIKETVTKLHSDLKESNDKYDRRNIEINTKLGALNEKMAVYETSFTFYGHRLDAQEKKVKILESQIRDIREDRSATEATLSTGGKVFWMVISATVTLIMVLLKSIIVGQG